MIPSDVVDFLPPTPPDFAKDLFCLFRTKAPVQDEVRTYLRQRAHLLAPARAVQHVVVHCRRTDLRRTIVDTIGKDGMEAIDDKMWKLVHNAFLEPHTVVHFITGDKSYLDEAVLYYGTSDKVCYGFSQDHIESTGDRMGVRPTTVADAM